MPRLAFVGQRVYFHYCALEQAAGDVEPAFFDFQPDSPPAELLAGVRAFAPDVVFVWRPELLPAGVLHDLDAVTLGYLTEPLPRSGGVEHADLRQRLEYLRRTDTSQFDRIISFDPLIAATVEDTLGVPVWRSFPIPVSDRYFAPVRPARGRPRIVFTGRSTEHRETFLGSIKHAFDVVHLAHGVTDERLMEFMAEADIGLNLHNEPYPTYENRVSVYLAAGLLTISETLSPRHGLQPGIDYAEIAEPWQLWDLVSDIARTPDAFHSVRVNGRRTAERFRASRVYPPLVRDALADVQLFGGRRDAPAVGTMG